jgi:hypothetical protein
MTISSNFNEIILINLIRIILFINNVINSISLILKTNDELMMTRLENDNFKLMLKNANEDNERNRHLINKLHTYYNLNIGLIKKIDEFKKTLNAKNDNYKTLERELYINIDDYFNLKLQLEQSYYNNKHLKFLLKKSNCNNRTLVKINRRLLL